MLRFVFARGSALFRTLRLGGPGVRKAWSNFAGLADGADVFVYRDCTVAHVLDIRRRLKAVVDVIDGIVR